MGDKGHDMGRWYIGCVVLYDTSLPKFIFISRQLMVHLHLGILSLLTYTSFKIRNGLMCLPSFGRSFTYFK